MRLREDKQLGQDQTVSPRLSREGGAEGGLKSRHHSLRAELFPQVHRFQCTCTPRMNELESFKKERLSTPYAQPPEHRLDSEWGEVGGEGNGRIKCSECS